MSTAQADAARTLVGVPIGITVLRNNSGGALTVVGYSQPVAGTVALNADQSFTYTPAAGFEGSDGFAYTVRDPVGGTASAEVTITVTRANAAPIAAGDTARLLAGDSVAVAVLANDNDPDGDTFGIIQGRRMRSAGDQRGHEVVVPGGGFALALEAGLQCRVGAREVERDLAEQRQVPGGGALTHPAGIFVETDVEHPVKSVLDRPMAADGGGELCRR